MEEDGAAAPPQFGPYLLSTAARQAHSGPINAASFDLRGNYLLTGGADKLVRLWSVQDQRLVRTLPGHGWDVLGVAM